MSSRCVESWPLISSTITDRERIFRWKMTRRYRDPFSYRQWGESWRSPNSASCITVTNDGCLRLIGSIRRECLDHVIVLNEIGLRRILKSYFDYYERSRTHLSLGKDAPVSRPVQPLGEGRIVAISQVGGLHHRYERVAA